MKKKLQKLCLTFYNFLVAQLKNINFNTNYSGIRNIKCNGHNNKNVKLVELHIKYATVFLNRETLKFI